MSDAKKAARALAKLRQNEIRSKELARKVQDSGYVESQLGHLTNEDRLLTRGFHRKSAERANLDKKLETIRDLKRELKGTDYKLVKRDNGKTSEVRDMNIRADRGEVMRKVGEKRPKKPEVRNICPKTGNVL